MRIFFIIHCLLLNTVMLFLIATPGYANETQLYVLQDQLYFIAPKVAYRYSSQGFVLSKIPVPVQGSDRVLPEYDNVIKITSLTPLRYQIVAEKCTVNVTEKRRAYAEGIVACTFFEIEQRAAFTMHHNAIHTYDVPYLSYHNYRQGGNYYIGLLVGEHLEAESVALVVFNKQEAPRLVEKPLDCRLGMSTAVYQWEQRKLCYEVNNVSWAVIEDNVLRALPQPCSNPDQLVVLNQVLWAHSSDRAGRVDLCQYDSAQLTLRQHFRYDVDVKKSLQSMQMPDLAIKHISPFYQEIDNGAFLGYKFELTQALKIIAETKNSFELEGDLHIAKPEDTVSVFNPDTEVSKTGEKVLKTLILPVANIVYSLDAKAIGQ